jgi:hypothetical protein
MPTSYPATTAASRVRAVDSVGFGDGQRGWYDGHTGVEGPVCVFLHPGMEQGAVGERGQRCRYKSARVQQMRFVVAFVQPDGLLGEVAEPGGSRGGAHDESVQKAPFGAADDGRGQAVVVDARREPAESLTDGRAIHFWAALAEASARVVLTATQIVAVGATLLFG